MCKTVFAILATTALLSTGMLAPRAQAMTPAPFGVADLVQQAAVVCGPRGCVHRPTPIRRPLWNSWGGGWGGGGDTWNMPTRLDETRWKMRALPMGMVRHAARGKLYEGH